MNNLKKNNKRNFGRSYGKISVRHVGGGSKKMFRIIDFLRKKYDIPAKVIKFEYDPYRNIKIALLKYNDGEYKYILKTENIRINDVIISSLKSISMDSGNSTIMKNIQVGTFLNCVGFFPGKKAIFARSAGSNCELIYKDLNFAIIKLSSGIKKKISINCMATIGKLVSEKKKIYKAGQKRWRGIRPTVRGVAMNPVDHPHGGGEGKSSGGRHPSTPWGKKTKGLKTKKKCQDL